MPPTARPIANRLEAAGLACIRGDRTIFARLEFALAGGELLLLEGPNGSGKSTLLRLLAGLLRPAAGKIAWNGRPVTDDPDAHRARLRLLGHLDAVKPSLSVADHLGFERRMRGAGDIAAALERVALTQLADLPGRVLSAGQRRRLALARLSLAPAELWLLDEPTVGLDSDSLARFRGLCEAHLAGGGMIVASTHAELGVVAARRLQLAEFAPLAADITEDAW